MSERLYRCPGCHGAGCWMCDNMVPVEACEHGNYARHLLYNEIEPCIFAIDKWCPGAGNGDTDAE